MTETDHAIESARGAVDRIKGRETLPVGRPRRRRNSGVARKLALIGVVNAVLLVGAGVVGFVLPIGLFGFLLVVMLMIAATLAIAFAPTARAPSAERLRETDLKALPAQTERWLEAQRPALPAPARTLVDQIGVRLDTLSPQLATLGEREPAAAEVRKLVGEQLPDFVRGYQKVPSNLRSVPRNGKTPDAQLIDGLSLIESQIAEMSAQLAQGDLDSLATRGRFLEIKYRGDGDA